MYMKIKEKTRKISYLTYSLIFMMLVFYFFNVIINKMDAITGATPYQMLEVGALTDSSSNWMLLTSLFVHGSIEHLVMNIVLLMILGSIIEKEYGIKMFLTVFIFSGLLGNLLTMLVKENIVVFGASGSIYGLLGAFAALLILNKDITLESNGRLILGVLVTIFVSIIYTVIGANINIIAHLTGLVVGFVLPLAIELYKKIYKITASDINNYKKG